MPALPGHCLWVPQDGIEDDVTALYEKIFKRKTMEMRIKDFIFKKIPVCLKINIFVKIGLNLPFNLKNKRNKNFEI